MPFLRNDFENLITSEIEKIRSQIEFYLGEADKEKRARIDIALDKVMQELDGKGRLETKFTDVQISLIFDLLRKINDIGESYNFFIETFSNPERKTRFLTSVEQFGITRANLISMYLAAHAVAGILSTEQFKLLLLFMVVGTYKISDFYNFIEREAPITWPELRPFIDNEFRNALAHGAYLLDKGKVILFKNAKVEVLREMPLQDFIMAVKNENILFWCMFLFFLNRMKMILL
jgi:hypothetical protein